MTHYQHHGLYNSRDFYGSVKHQPMERLKKMTGAYDNYTDFDHRVDQDGAIGHNWRPMRVSRNILELSDSRQLNKDMEFATSNEDDYKKSEDYCLWQTFMGANQRIDEDSNPAEDYASALMQRTRYTNNDNEDCMGDSNSLDVAARFDRGRKRFPFELNPLKYDVSADFYDDTFEEPIRSTGRVARSKINRMPCIGNRQRYTMPKKLPIGNPLFDPAYGQQNDPRINDGSGTAKNSVFRRPGPHCGNVLPPVNSGIRTMSCQTQPIAGNKYITPPSGGTFDWNPYNNATQQQRTQRYPDRGYVRY